MRKLFTSESVTEGHQIKFATRYQMQYLMLYLKKDPNARVACETV